MAGFWESHARSAIRDEKSGLANLETNPVLAEKKIDIERSMLSSYICSNPAGTFLDFGAGYGEWSLYFHGMFRKVIAYEQSPTMCDLFAKKVKENSVNNVEIIKTDITKIKSIDLFSVALLSGIFIYLTDDDIANILSLLYKVSNEQSIVILRDATGLNGDYSVNGQFSEALQQNYHAFYRSRERYIDLFKASGFDLIQDEDMFPRNSDLNKWKETRLRIYKFSNGSTNE